MDAAQLFEQRQVARTPFAERPFVSDTDFSKRLRVLDQLANEILRRCRGKRAIVFLRDRLAARDVRRKPRQLTRPQRALDVGEPIVVAELGDVVRPRLLGASLLMVARDAVVAWNPVTQSIDVTADVQTVQTSNSEVATTVTNEQVRRLPMLDRDPMALITTQATT